MSMRASAIQPIPRRTGASRGTARCRPASRRNGDQERNRHLRKLCRPRTDPGYNAQRADSAKHKGRSKNERKIECPSLKRLHDRDLLRSFRVIRSLLLGSKRRTLP